MCAASCKKSMEQGGHHIQITHFFNSKPTFSSICEVCRGWMKHLCLKNHILILSLNIYVQTEYVGWEGWWISITTDRPELTKSQKTPSGGNNLFVSWQLGLWISNPGRQNKEHRSHIEAGVACEKCKGRPGNGADLKWEEGEAELPHAGKTTFVSQHTGQADYSV